MNWGGGDANRELGAGGIGYDAKPREAVIHDRLDAVDVASPRGFEPRLPP